MADKAKTYARGRPSRFHDRRPEVLRTAARVFSHLGFRQATLDDIAGVLGIKRPALYHYAKSKDTLLAECGKIARRQISGAVAEAMREPDGAAQLTSFFKAYAEIISDDFGRCFAVTDLSEINPYDREVVRDSQVSIGEAIAGMIRLGQSDGTIRSCDPVEVSRTLFSAFNGMARRWNVHSDRTPTEIAETILDIFMRGLAPREPARAGRLARGLVKSHAAPVTRKRSRR